MNKTVALQPVAMVKPNSQFNYSPSRLRPKKTISEAEFLEKYADHAKEILVDGVRQTAYSWGLDCWYIVVP